MDEFDFLSPPQIATKITDFTVCLFEKGEMAFETN